MFIPPGYGLGLFSNTETGARKDGVLFVCFGHAKGMVTYSELDYNVDYTLNMIYIYLQPNSQAYKTNRCM